MKAREMRQLTQEELLKELGSLREALFRLRVRRTTGEAATASEFPRLRRELARILTLLKEQELAAAGPGPEQGAHDNA